MGKILIGDNSNCCSTFDQYGSFIKPSVELLQQKASIDLCNCASSDFFQVLGMVMR